MKKFDLNLKSHDTNQLLVYIQRAMYGIGFFFEPLWGAYIKYYTVDSTHESMFARFLMSIFLGIAFLSTLQKDFYTKYYRLITLVLICLYIMQRYYLLGLNPTGWNAIIDCYTISLIAIMVAPTVIDSLIISIIVLGLGLLYTQNDAALFFNLLTAVPLFTSFKYLTLTEHIQLENSKKQIRDEGLLSGAKSFIGTISHDINNSLQKISLLNNLVLHTKEQDQILKINEKINEEITKTSLIITSFKDVINNKVLEPNYYQNTELMANSVLLYNEHIKSSKIDLEISNENFYVYIDEKSFRNIVQPIIKNAIDELRKLDNKAIKKIWLNFKEEETYYYINIVNSGPKIPKNIESKIFDSFFTTKSVGDGIGLGLSIAKDVAIKNNSQLYYDSTKDLVTFTLKIPKNQ